MALNALYKIGESNEWSGDEDDAISLTIDILSVMGDSKDLWTYAQWVLVKDARTAMAIFTHSKRADMEHGLFLEFDKVLGYLREDIIGSIDDYEEQRFDGFDYIEFYLEFIVRKCTTSESVDSVLATYHDQLAYCYMAKIQRLSAVTKEKSGTKSRRRSTIKCASTKLEVVRRKLLEFLEQSTLVDNSELLSHAKKFKLYDEIIELNKKLRKHNDVLHTLVMDKRDHQEAIKYCMQTVPSSKDRSDRFLELLRLYFSSNDTPKNDPHIVRMDSAESIGSELDLEPRLHRKRQTINLELLTQELNAEPDEFAFMDFASESSRPGSPTKYRDRSEPTGMGFDFEDENDAVSGSATNSQAEDVEPLNTRQRSVGVEMPNHTRQRSGVPAGGVGIASFNPTGLTSVDENSIETELFERGCDILYEYAFEMDPLRVLQLLPASMDVTFLENYIRKIVPYVVHKRRTRQIAKNLQKRLYLRQRTELAQVRSQFIKMDYGSVCTKCGKRIGQSVFILQPRTLKKFHYSCFYRKRQPQNPQLMAQYTDDSVPAMRSDEESDMYSNQQQVSYQSYEQPKLDMSTNQESNNPFANSIQSNQQQGNNPFAQESVQIAPNVGSNPFANTESESQSYNPFGDQKGTTGQSGQNTRQLNGNNPFQTDTSNLQQTNPFL